MATTGGKVFVDTNVLLRAVIRRMAFHKQAEAFIQQLWSDNIDLWISRQVLREFLVQATHPKTFTPNLTLKQVLEQLEMIESLFRVVDETVEVTAELKKLLKAYLTQGKQVHDANIVATMLSSGLDTLITINIEDFKRFSKEIKIIPFIPDNSNSH